MLVMLIVAAVQAVVLSSFMRLVAERVMRPDPMPPFEVFLRAGTIGFLPAALIGFAFAFQYREDGVSLAGGIGINVLQYLAFATTSFFMMEPMRVDQVIKITLSAWIITTLLLLAFIELVRNSNLVHG